MIYTNEKSKTYKLESGCGKLYVIIAHDENFEPRAVFLRNRGGCASSIQMIGILISQQLQDGADIREIARTLRKGDACGMCNDLEVKTKSCSTLIAGVLIDFYEHYIGSRKEVTPAEIPKGFVLGQSGDGTLG